MGDVLRTDPSIYARLRNAQTQRAVTFWKCVKAAFHSRGHPMINTVGAFAGDEHCYETFRDFYDQVLALRHPGFDPKSMEARPVDFNSSDVSTLPIEVGSGHVLGAKVRIVRNLADYRFPSACSFEERREVERHVVDALTEEVPGVYRPLCGSTSCSTLNCPGVMTSEEEDGLVEQGLCFEEPDSEFMLAAGFAKEWPDARGVYVGNDRATYAWLNAEDHLRLWSTVPGDGLRDAFIRICRLQDALESSLRASGCGGFSHSKRIGFLTSCPSNVGTGLVATVTLRIPLLSGSANFRTICKNLQLQAHVVGDQLYDGVWELVNAARFGVSEVEQVNLVLDGCRHLVELEAKLERGEQL